MTKKVYGALSIPDRDFEKFEGTSIKLRMKYRVFAEIKWERLEDFGKYFDFYFNLLKYLFSFEGVKYHCNGFEGSQYTSCYALIRSISWKLKDIDSSMLQIILDSSGSKGKSETRLTKDFLNKDSTMYHRVNTCTTGNSEILCSIQMCDLLTGCVGYSLNHEEIVKEGKDNKAKDKFVENVKNEIDIDLIATSRVLWSYYSKNIQYYELLKE